MTKLCKDLAELILKNWPKAELFVQTGNNSLEGGNMITYLNQWFITLSFDTGTLFVTVYMVTKAVKEQKWGYRFLKEYQVKRMQKDSRFAVSHQEQHADQPPVKLSWSLSELISHMQSEISKSKSF